MSKELTRRGLLKAAGITATALGLGYAIRNRETLFGETDGEIIQGYEDAFKETVKGYEQGEKLYDYYQSKKRIAEIDEGIIIAQEPGNVSENFWVAVNRNDNFSSGVVTGAAQYTKENNVLQLAPIKITDIWKGVLLGHEVIHIRDDLEGLEGETIQDFYAGEVKAYEFEFGLLNNITNGKFESIIQDVISDEPSGYVRTGLTPTEYDEIDRLFERERGRREGALRESAYLIAANYRILDRDYVESADEQKAYFQYLLQTGQIPIKPLH